MPKAWKTKVAEQIFLIDKSVKNKYSAVFKLDFFAFNVGTYPTVAVRYEFFNPVLRNSSNSDNCILAQSAIFFNTVNGDKVTSGR